MRPEAVDVVVEVLELMVVGVGVSVKSATVTGVAPRVFPPLLANACGVVKAAKATSAVVPYSLRNGT